MRNAAREAALNIIFAQHFNTDYIEPLKRKVFKQFKLEKEDDLAFANALISSVEKNRSELIEGI